MPAAPSLRSVQSHFLDALYDGDPDVVAALIDGAGLDVQARVRVYRNSGLLTHTETLRTTYPAVLALVGEDFFESAAMLYRRAHRSTSGNLQDFGAEFPAFLASFPNAQSLTYLTDVAKLEWLRQEAALAVASAPLRSAALQEILVTTNGMLRLELHPSVRLFASRHAVLTLWRYAMAADGQRLQLPAEGEQLVLWRSGAEVAMASLDAASFACICALSRGMPIDDAHHEALALDPDFAWSTCIGTLLSESLITAFHPITKDTAL